MKEDAKDFEKRVKSAWNCWKGSDLDQFCLVRSAHGAGIHVSVCVVVCFVCQNQWICELNIMCRSHSLSLCVHASGDLQLDCVQTSSCWSDSSLLLFDSWRSFLTTWSRSTCLETRTKEFWHVCKFTSVKPTSAMKVNAWICAPATDRDLESGLSKSANARTRKMVNYAWEAQRYWRANRS